MVLWNNDAVKCGLIQECAVPKTAIILDINCLCSALLNTAATTETQVKWVLNMIFGCLHYMHGSFVGVFQRLNYSKCLPKVLSG